MFTTALVRALRSFLEMAALVATCGLLAYLAGTGFTSCAGPADAAILNGQVPAGKAADVSVLGAELQPGAMFYRVEHPGESICYVVVGQMTGMAGGATAALDCVDQRR